MTIRLYYGSTSLVAHARVQAIDQDDHGLFVVLDQTVAAVKGGGAKADRGTIGTMPFNDVLADGRDGDPRHYLASQPTFCVGDIVEVRIDPEWRAIQEAYHTAGHLLAAVAEEQFPSLQATGGHHYPGEARIEFVGHIPADLNDLKTKLNSALKAAIECDLPIQILDPSQNRQVQIGVFKPVGCGGVHSKSTSELGQVEIKSVKAKAGKLRLSYEVEQISNAKGDYP